MTIFGTVIAPTANGQVANTPIAIKAASLKGSLGYATSGEISGLKNGGSFQCYQLGCILYSPATGAKVSTGAIRTTWAATGFENGYLGYPVSDEVGGLKNGGAYQNYQGGAIMWSPATGAQISTGAIRTAWAATGFENGFLGYPVTHEVGGLKNGGSYQNYQGGAIMWSPATGAHISTGGIRSVWAASGFENGVLGYPTGNEVSGLRDGGVYQMYEGGAILWSPATGGFISMGGIRSLWASTGFESGRLGYPTSNEYSTGPGGQVAQNYQGGTIKWSPSGSSIVYNTAVAPTPPPVVAPTPPPVASGDAYAVPVMSYKTTIHLNLRSGPGTEYEAVGSGVTGTTVSGTGKANGIWYEVQLNGKTGWMSSQYLQRIETAANSVANLQAFAGSKLNDNTQLQCLITLWERESNWNYTAINPEYAPNNPATPTYQAYGIAQSAPGSKMATFGSDWQTNPRTQILWGLDYIAKRYSSSCKALEHSDTVGWY